MRLAMVFLALAGTFSMTSTAEAGLFGKLFGCKSKGDSCSAPCASEPTCNPVASACAPAVHAVSSACAPVVQACAPVVQACAPMVQACAPVCAPVVCAPAPVVCAPAPVIYQSAPIVYSAPIVRSCAPVCAPVARCAPVCAPVPRSCCRPAARSCGGYRSVSSCGAPRARGHRCGLLSRIASRRACR
jgi:hypothetical protein